MIAHPLVDTTVPRVRSLGSTTGHFEPYLVNRRPVTRPYDLYGQCGQGRLVSCLTHLRHAPLDGMILWALVCSSWAASYSLSCLMYVSQLTAVQQAFLRLVANDAADALG